MVFNDALEALVIATVAQAIHEPATRSRQALESAKKRVILTGKLLEDRPYKFKYACGRFRGYGYDFDQVDKSTAIPVKRQYDEAVQNTRMISGSPATERLLFDTVIDGRFGIYLTALG